MKKHPERWGALFPLSLLIATPVAAQTGAYAGKSVSITMDEQCPSNPDPSGFAGDDVYSRCGQAELDGLHHWLAIDLKRGNLFGAIDRPPSELTLTITLAKDQRTSGGTLVSAKQTLEMEAEYSLTDAQGHLVKDGVIDNEGPATASHEDVQQGLMLKVAAALAGAK